MSGVQQARPLGRVVRAEEWGLYADAEAALAQARQDAAALRQAAAAESQAESESIRAASLQEAQAEATRLLAETAMGVQAQLASVRMAVAEAIATGIARVIGELDMAEAVARAAVHAINGLQDRNGIAVRVAPELVQPVRQRLAAALIEVIADTTLQPDDCVVQTQAGFVRAGLNAQVATLQAALAEAAV